MRSHMRCSLGEELDSIMSTRRLILEVRAWTEAERTASSSRRSANWRDTSAGRESRDWVYSERRVRALAVDNAPGSLVSVGTRVKISWTIWPGREINTCYYYDQHHSVTVIISGKPIISSIFCVLSPS